MKIQIGSTEGITIGDDVWIGVGVRITDGVSVGSGCVIGAGAVVLENIPDYAIAAGVPAKVIGNRKK
jgi:acetyltransferase-like isoleucine patch superfamily enzyme